VVEALQGELLGRHGAGAAGFAMAISFAPAPPASRGATLVQRPAAPREGLRSERLPKGQGPATG
jgi:hypothetical protein